MTRSDQFTVLVVAAAFAVFTSDSASAENPRSGADLRVQTDVGKATEDLVNGFDRLADKLEKRPAQVNPSKWDNVLAGAEEITTKVGELKRLRADIHAAVGDLSTATGTVRSRLAVLKTEFESLAAEAGAEADGSNGKEALPEMLLEAIRREAAIYARGANVCESASKKFAETIAAQKDQVAAIDRCGPLLDRMGKAASNYAELARLGKQIETARDALASFADEFNALLGLFEKLAEKTSDAVTTVRPNNVGAAGKATPGQQYPVAANMPQNGQPAVRSVAQSSTSAAIRNTPASQNTRSAKITGASRDLAQFPLGTQDGVRQNDVLLVYRAGVGSEHGKERFVGRLTVTRTEGDRAAGTVDGQWPKVGDEVLLVKR